jgi:hypothetical protein
MEELGPVPQPPWAGLFLWPIKLYGTKKPGSGHCWASEDRNTEYLPCVQVGKIGKHEKALTPKCLHSNGKINMQRKKCHVMSVIMKE